LPRSRCCEETGWFHSGPYQAAVGQDDRRPVGVFSGQGSQWAQMGAELLATEPVFAATVAQAEPWDVEEYS